MAARGRPGYADAVPLVLQTEDLDPLCAAWLGERCELVRCGPSDEPRFSGALAEASGLVVRTYTRVDRALIERAPNLRVVGRAGVALENVDVRACLDRGVRVVHTPGSNTRAVVEFVAALLADAVRPRVFLDGPLEGEAWHQARRELVGERELCEMTLGVCGVGRIGSGVARLGAALDMRVLACDIADVPDDRLAGAERVGFERLLAESDVLSVHVDYRAANERLFGADAFARLKPDALFVNTSRGFVVDAEALAEYLRRCPGARAMVDVHDPAEPIGPGYPLLGLPNAHLTPHLASGTARAKREMSWVVRDVWRVLEGREPEFPPPAWLLADAGAGA